MRKFNPEKELKKIQHGNKNKLIFGVCLLLVIVAIGSSYALYQVKYNKRIIYTTVEPFYSKDMQLAVYVNGVRKEEFPEKSDNMLYGGYECERGSKITFNKDKWNITLETNHPDKCNIIFGKKYEDKSGANYPELYQGLIPIYFKEGKIYVADVTSEWYDYDEHEWANAVLIDNTNPDIKSKFYDENGNLRGRQEVEESDILQMYVWIPRYKYELFNVNNEGVPKQIINIQFENETETTGTVSCTYTNTGDGTIKENCTNERNGEWYTHPAFTFKGTTETSGTELSGIWVGKFEPSDPTDLNGRTNTYINEITILPDKTSIVNKSISTAFFSEQKLSEEGNKYNLSATEVDTRVMKNIEWGAVAYLTQSLYGIYKDEKTCGIDNMGFDECEVWINNTAQGAGNNNSNVKYKYGGTYTGCVANTATAGVIWNEDDGSVAKCKEGNRWNESGVKASTTGNMYGIYDMVGGAWEYIMGATVNQKNGGLNLSGSGFQTSTLPETKYYDMYTFNDSAYNQAFAHLGDTTRETLKTFGSLDGSWNADYSYFPWTVDTWFGRGGGHYDTTHTGVFAFVSTNGGANNGRSFRSVLTAA